MISYLDISVEADSRVIDTLQALERHRTLLLIVDEEDDDPACEVKQYSYCGSFANATIRPASSHREKSTKDMTDVVFSAISCQICEMSFNPVTVLC